MICTEFYQGNYSDWTGLDWFLPDLTEFYRVLPREWLPFDRIWLTFYRIWLGFHRFTGFYRVFLSVVEEANRWRRRRKRPPSTDVGSERPVLITSLFLSFFLSFFFFGSWNVCGWCKRARSGWNASRPSTRSGWRSCTASSPNWRANSTASSTSELFFFFPCFLSLFVCFFLSFFLSFFLRARWPMNGRIFFLRIGQVFDRVQPCWTELDRVSRHFTEFYGVLPSFQGLYRVLRGFTEFSGIVPSFC